MSKKLSVFILILLLFAQSSFSWGASLFQEIKVLYNDIQVRVMGNDLPLDEEPFMYNDRVYLPLRAVSEALGYEVDWDSFNKRVVINEKSPLDLLPAANPLVGEAFIYGEIIKIDFDKQLIEIEQHMENNSREVFEALAPIEDAVFLLKRNSHYWQISFDDLRVGDVVGIILTRENGIRGVIVD